jgi:hypothetical protein
MAEYPTCSGLTERIYKNHIEKIKVDKSQIKHPYLRIELNNSHFVYWRHCGYLQSALSRNKARGEERRGDHPEPRPS